MYSMTFLIGTIDSPPSITVDGDQVTALTMQVRTDWQGAASWHSLYFVGPLAALLAARAEAGQAAAGTRIAVVGANRARRAGRRSPTLPADVGRAGIQVERFVLDPKSSDTQQRAAIAWPPPSLTFLIGIISDTPSIVREDVGPNSMALRLRTNRRGETEFHTLQFTGGAAEQLAVRNAAGEVKVGAAMAVIGSNLIQRSGRRTPTAPAADPRITIHVERFLLDAAPMSLGDLPSPG